MKNIKKILILVAFVFAANMLDAQPPAPPTKPNNHANQSINRANNTPVGTATALLVALGAGYTAYKVRKNTKADDDKQEK